MEIFENKETGGWLLKDGDRILNLTAEEFDDLRGGVLPIILYRMKYGKEAKE
ncbi:MAG: hypothetical protein ABH851_02605 [Methanobacteriota archaeon]